MRLIDADELKLCYTGSDTNKASYLSIRKMIDTSKTTYDIDKVVEELEENASRYTKKYITPYGNNGYRDTKAISIHKAIEIVKQGGVAVANNATTKKDDVCEWESASNGEFIQNPHTKRLFSNEQSMQNVYCNTCGKKIKVVE